MTLVITSINAARVVQASDRLTTRWSGRRLRGQHDPLANKTVIYLSRDGPMVVSFAGMAYVGTEPTDNWIARHLAGEDHHRWPDGRIPMISFKRLPVRRFNEAIWILQKAIEAEPAFAGGLEVAVAGWRIRRRRLAQTAIVIVRTKDETVREGHMRLRTADFGGAILKIGSECSASEIHAAAASHPKRDRLLFDPVIVSDVLQKVIVAKSQSNAAVGSDVMAVEMPRWGSNEAGTVTIRYMPSSSRLAVLAAGRNRVTIEPAYWPWIVTPAGVQAPSVSTGGSGSELSLCGWKFRFEAPPPAQDQPVLFAASSIRRPPPV